MINKFDYYYWPKMFSHNELLDLHSIFNTTQDKNVFDEPAINVTKISNVKFSKWSNLKNKLEKLEQYVLEANQQYFGYNLWPQYDNNNLLLNEYDSKIKAEYDWHNDNSGSDIFDFKFTTLINTSIENYEGGEFNLFLNKPTHIDKLDNPGDVVMFKSHLYHKVNTITSGKRHSITIFYKGPRFI